MKIKLQLEKFRQRQLPEANLPGKYEGFEKLDIEIKENNDCSIFHLCYNLGFYYFSYDPKFSDRFIIMRTGYVNLNISIDDKNGLVLNDPKVVNTSLDITSKTSDAIIEMFTKTRVYERSVRLYGSDILFIIYSYYDNAFKFYIEYNQKTGDIKKLNQVEISNIDIFSGKNDTYCYYHFILE